MKRRWLVTLIAGFLGAVILAWIIVPATIIPPAAPANPVIVHVAESGLHAHLVMPLGDRWVQYEFGDWHYFALERRTVFRGVLALLFPTPGALGRREITALEPLQARWEQAGYRLLNFEVSAAAVTRLQRSLNDRFEAAAQQQVVYNRQLNVNLVQYGQSYSLLHNSNHELAEWLQALNCQVESLSLWSEFRLADPH